jgi:hypothetical protein
MQKTIKFNMLTHKVAFKTEATLRLNNLTSQIGPLIQSFTGNTLYCDLIVRAIIPIIDHMSSRIATRRIFILQEIGIAYPEIFWHSVRHGLVHNSKQLQGLKIAGSDKALLIAYDTAQMEIIRSEESLLLMNPLVFYEKTVQWLRKMELYPSYELVEYTYMLEINPDKNSELLKELQSLGYY